ncbi:hypothetical protein GB881_19595, partial [Georgenia subflava]
MSILITPGMVGPARPGAGPGASRGDGGAAFESALAAELGPTRSASSERPAAERSRSDRTGASRTDDAATDRPSRDPHVTEPARQEPEGDAAGSAGATAVDGA